MGQREQSKYNELVKQVKLPAYEGLSKEQIDHLYDLVAEGGSQKQVDDYLGVRGEKTFTQEEVQSMLDKQRREMQAAAPAPAPLPAATQQPPVIIAQPAEKKPDKPSGMFPAEDRAEKPLRVYVPGNSWVLLFFQVNGAQIEPPRSKAIPFKRYVGEAAQRFGRAADVSHRCFYVTWDKKEIDLFMKDDRWGSFFSTDEEKGSISGTETFTRAYSKYYAQYASMHMNDLRSMIPPDSGIPLGATIWDIRTKLATYMAIKEVESLGGHIEVKEIEQRKAQLMQANARR